jgi:hypothetical protein
MIALVLQVTKNKTDIEVSLSVLKSAKDHIDRNPSKAGNSGETIRTAMHLLTRTLNRLNLMMEVSDYQISAALLGLPTELCTETFAYTAPYNHLALIKHEKIEHLIEARGDKLYAAINKHSDQIELDACDSDDDQSFDSFIEDDDDIDSQHGDIDDSEIVEDPPIVVPDFYSNLGPAPFYTIDDDDRKIPVPYPVHYRYRGSQLAKFNRYEYYSLVAVKKKKKSSSNLGRAAFQQYPFAQGHPLHATHEQHLQAKHPVLIFSGRPPKHPGPKPAPDDFSDEIEHQEKMRKWDDTGNAFAAYYLCMFRSEEKSCGCTVGVAPSLELCYDWDDFVSFVIALEEEDTAISRLRLRAMQLHIEGNSSTYRAKRLLQQYRGKSRTLWPKEQRRQIAFDRYCESEEAAANFDNMTEEEFEALHNQIDTRTMRSMEAAVQYSKHLLERFAESDNDSNNHSNSRQLYNHANNNSALFTDMDVYGDTSLNYDLCHYGTNEPESGLTDNSNEGDITSNDGALDTSDHDPVPKIPPNEQQQKVINFSSTMLHRTANMTAETANANPDDDMSNVVLLTGAAGTGKSFTIKAIQNLQSIWVALLSLLQIMPSMQYTYKDQPLTQHSIRLKCVKGRKKTISTASARLTQLL